MPYKLIRPGDVPSSGSATPPDGLVSQRRLAEQTERAYAKDYEDFARFRNAADGLAALQDLFAMTADAAEAAVLAYIAHLTVEGRKEATIARRVNALRSAVRRSHGRGEVAWLLGVIAPRTRRAATPRLDLVGFARMLELLEGRRDAKGTRDRCIVRMMWGLMLHRGELVMIDLEDVDLDVDLVAVRGWGQTTKRWRTLPAGVRSALEDWLVARGPGVGPLFHSLHLGRPGSRLTADAVHEIVRRLGKEVGLDTPIRPGSIGGRWIGARRRSALVKADGRACGSSGEMAPSLAS